MPPPRDTAFTGQSFLECYQLLLVGRKFGDGVVHRLAQSGNPLRVGNWTDGIEGGEMGARREYFVGIAMTEIADEGDDVMRNGWPGSDVTMQASEP